MYVIEISDVNGAEVWYEGPGWYWTDQNFLLHGPYLTEQGAVTDYAWHVHAILGQVNEIRQKLNDSPRIVSVQ